MSVHFVPDPSWPTIVELAIELWGQPNKTLSRRDDIRFGTYGSKSVKPSAIIWKDHQSGDGGGYVEMWRLARRGASLPKRETTQPDQEAGNGLGGRVPPWENIGKRYPYLDAAGHLVMEVIRTITGNPRFLQRRPDPSTQSGWKWSVKDIPVEQRPLYRLPELIASHADTTVWIPEGEKDADNLATRGLTATCNIGGAGKWRPGYGVHFTGRHVVILPDNDPPGRDHASHVAASLAGVAASVRILELPDLQPKGDVSDWLASGGDAETLERLARDIPAYVPPAPPDTPGGGDEEPPPGDPDGPGGGGPRPDEPPEIPVIYCLAGELPRMIREAQAALLKAAVPVYQRHALVRPVEEEYAAADGRTTHSAALLAFTPPAMLKLLAEVAIWQKWDGRAKAFVDCDPPDRVVNVLLAARGDWRFPVVRGILTCPTLRPDGSVLADAGYDPRSRYYLAFPSNLVMPNIPDKPTRAEADASLKRLNALLGKFPFVDNVSEAVALCILMTQVLRCAMECSPLLCASANAPGTGKSFLIDLASTIAIGRPCPVIPPARNDEETEKGIRTKLISSTPAFSIDNVHGDLNLPILNMATERTRISIRLFGVLEEIEVENSVVVYMTGNNLAIVDEQGRRSFRCCMDTMEAQPEFREFDFNPIDAVLADRGRYIADILTIARAYLTHRASGGARPDIPPMGDSHKAWSKLVREPLFWLGCEDPIGSQEISRQSDPVSNRLGTIINAWDAAFGMGAHTLAEAARYATTIPVFRADNNDTERNDINLQTYHTHKAAQEGLLAALRDGFAAGKDGVDTHKWGNWMRKFEGRPGPSGDFRFVKARDVDGKPTFDHGAVKWKLASVPR